MISRRGLVAGAGAGAVGVAAGLAGGHAYGDQGGHDGDSVDLSRSFEFYTGGHQAGIATPPQRHSVFMTFDLTSTSKQDLQVLLARWSAGIAQMMAGKPVGDVAPERAGAVAADTGEAFDLAPASLTVTVGLGPGIFDDRFGLQAKRPALLSQLPALPSDRLRPELTGGDLSVQACADDPQVAYHAVRDLARMGRGTVNTRWTVMGFGRASAGQGQSTPRNLMGFKDGTRNIRSDADLDRFVWLGQDSAPGGWMAGGTYQVARKISMNIETWDASDISTQQNIFARAKASGAPLSGGTEFSTPDFANHHMDPKSHVALAAHENNDGIKILRRGYNFTDGINELGQLDAGLLFVAYMNDPGHFVKLQTKLGASDLLNEYISHIGSGIWAVPPAPRPGHYLAERLFA